MENDIKKELTLSREINAPLENVFKAWTDPEQLAKWWGPKDFTDTVREWDAREGGKINLVMHGPDKIDYPMKGAFHEVVKNSKIVFTGTAVENEKGESLLENLNTLTFSEEKGKTKITLQVRVLKSSPETATALDGMEEGWSQSLDKLNKLVTKETAPVVIERTYSANAETIWKALTEKEQMKKWYFDIAEFKPAPGFEFEFTAGDDKKQFLHLCKVTEALPNKKIQYTWRYNNEPGESLVTFELFGDEEGKTRVRVTHEGLETFPSVQDFAKGNFYGGWTHILGISLKQYLDKLK